MYRGEQPNQREQATGEPLSISRAIFSGACRGR